LPEIAGGSFSNAVGTTTLAYDFPTRPYDPGQGHGGVSEGGPNDPPSPIVLQVTPGPVRVTDPLGRVTTYDYCDPNTMQNLPANIVHRCLVTPMPAAVTDPGGIRTEYTWDMVLGVVLQSRQYGSDDPARLNPIVRSATYHCTPADFRACVRPRTATDARGNTIEYDYDPAHGAQGRGDRRAVDEVGRGYRHAAQQQGVGTAVRPVIIVDQHLVIRGLVREYQVESDAALADFRKSLTLRPGGRVAAPGSAAGSPRATPPRTKRAGPARASQRRIAGEAVISSYGGVRPCSDVQPLAHFLAGLEIGDAFRRDVDRVAGARVAALAGVAGAGREGAEAAQLDAAAILQLLDDRIEDRRNHALDLLQGQIRMIVAKLLDKFGTDHGRFPLQIVTHPERITPAFAGPSRPPGRTLASKQTKINIGYRRKRR